MLIAVWSPAAYSPRSARYVPSETGALPRAPGVYLFYDAHGLLLYVGKAKRLRARVRSYFRAGPMTDKTVALRLRIATIVVRRAPTEADALAREARLIRAAKPPFNVRLREGGPAYPWLRVASQGDVSVTAVRAADDATYLGPVVAPARLREALRTTRALYAPPLPAAWTASAPSALVVRRRERAFQRDMAALCASAEAEAGGGEQAPAVLRRLARACRIAANQQHFERAARFRDAMRAWTQFLTDVAIARRPPRRAYLHPPRDMKIYTKGGDRGTTGLLGGQRVPKDEPRLAVTGTVDELNTVLGVAIAHLPPSPLRTQLEHLQPDLFAMGSHLVAVPVEGRATPTLPPFPSARVPEMEDWIDVAVAALPPLTRFIMPGGTLAGATLHQARAVCRRAERALVTLHASEPLDAGLLVYLNRLSDYLFVAARQANQLGGVPEIQWRPEERAIAAPIAGSGPAPV